MATTTKDTLIHEVTNRQTGTLIKIVKLAKPQGDDLYAAQCSEHGAQKFTHTRRDAHAAGRVPKSWCATCKKGANGTKVATPAPAKKVAAKKAPAKRATAKAGK